MRPYGGSSTSLNDFKQTSLLGEGAYSSVYKVIRLADKETYALKKVKLPSLSDKEKQNALNEVRLLASVVNKYIIAYKEAFFDERTRCLCIVQEYADGGDVLQQVGKCHKERKHIPEPDVWRYLNGMVQGLKALHNMQILHRDLKCANVFLHNSQDGLIAKLGDFNVSKVAKRGLCMTQTGTPYYASPEVWRDMPYDAKSDMWSLGCVLYETVALRPPFRAEDMEGLYKKVLRGQYHRIPSHYSKDVAEVIAALLQVNPRQRPTVDQLIQMPLLRRHIPELGGVVPEARPTALLNTIKLPSNATEISGMLPQPRYDLPKVLGTDECVSADDDRAGSRRSVGSGRSKQRGPAYANTELCLGQPLTPPPAVGPVNNVGQRDPDSGHVSPVHGEPDSLDALRKQQAPAVGPIKNAGQRDPDSGRVSPVHGEPDSLDALRKQQARQQQQRHQPPRRPSRSLEAAEEAPSEYSAQTRATAELPPVQAGRGRYNPRPPGHAHEARRAMAQYARPQYTLGSQRGGPSQPTRLQAPKPPGAEAVRRLPPIYSQAAV